MWNSFTVLGIALATAAAGFLLAWSVTLRRRLELERALRVAQRAARTDSLTGLWNRQGLEEFLQIQSAISRRYGWPCALVLFDVDYFKQVNDACGHAAGDALLRQLAELLRVSIREADLLARFGGEEFALVLPQTDREGAGIVARRIHAVVGTAEFGSSSSPRRIALSGGVALLGSQEQASHWLERADRALYRAKQLGRNQICIAEPEERPDPQP